MAAHRPAAVVTGASRGIGAQVVRELTTRGFEIIACARNPDTVDTADGPGGGKVVPFAFDVTSDAHADELRAALERYEHGVQVLVNNAGVVEDGWRGSIMDVPLAVFRSTWETNVLGAVRAARAAWPSMQRSASRPRIVNVSSGMGQLAEMGGRSPAYRTSKTMLNAVTRILAAELDDEAFVASVCPGWVRTDMGGADAPRSVEAGADTIVWLAADADVRELQSGLFWRDRDVIAF